MFDSQHKQCSNAKSADNIAFKGCQICDAGSRLLSDIITVMMTKNSFNLFVGVVNDKDFDHDYEYYQDNTYHYFHSVCMTER